MVSIDELVGAEYEESVKVTSGKIPLLEVMRGGGTERFVRAFHSGWLARISDSLRSNYSNMPESMQYAFEEVEALVKFGAIAAKSHTQETRVYELACGTAIPSIVYYMLTGKPATAIDVDKNELNNADAIAKGVEARVDFQESRVQDYMVNVNLKPEDIVIASSCSPDVASYAKNLITNNKFTLILCGVFKEDLLNSTERDFRTQGYNVHTAINNAYYKFMKAVNRFDEPLQSYVILSTPEIYK